MRGQRVFTNSFDPNIIKIINYVLETAQNPGLSSFGGNMARQTHE